jgi:hypothetical protein
VDRVDDLLVASAAAEVAGKSLANLVVGRIRDAVKEVMRGHDEPWRTEATLDGSGLDERRLDEIKDVIVRESFDRGDLTTLGLSGEHKARAHEHTVEVDGAGTALTLLTRVLRTRKPKVLAEQKEQAFFLSDRLGFDRGAIHSARNDHLVAPKWSSR